MRITEIKESGCSNILSWAISNNADIKNDPALVSLINDELFYLITLSDVNFFQLFRLTQIIRDQLRIRNERTAVVPTIEKLEEFFPTQDGKGDEASTAGMVKEVIEDFVGLVKQMSSDDDIITRGTARLFLPMITRTFDVQIPMRFIDFIDEMTAKETFQLFTHEYPNTLSKILEEEAHGVRTKFMMGVFNGTKIIRYDPQYDKLLKAIKYAPLKTYQKNRMYKLALLGFSKQTGGGEVRCNLFKMNPTQMQEKMKQLVSMSSQLEFDFMVQLPIQHMQIIENSFSRDILPVSYESSMRNIVENDLIYDNLEDPTIEESEKVTTDMEAYRIRIAESNKRLMNMIEYIFSQNQSDPSFTFSLLPSVYRTNAMFQVNNTNIKDFMAINDPIISDMFEEMYMIMNSVSEDIRKSKWK